MTLSTASRAAATERQVARTATSSPAVTIGRFGFLARGAVYLVVGWLALLAAVGAGSTATDKQGALEALSLQPYGIFLVGLAALGLFAYAVWSVIRAVFDPERKGHDTGGLIKRVSYAVAGASYAGLAIGAAQFALGAGSVGKGSDASTQDWTGRLLQAPFGPPLVIAVGAIFLAVAAAEFISAYKVDFRKELNLDALGADARASVVLLGRMGLVARGVVFGLIGVFLIQAARHDNAGEAIGLGGALQKLAAQSYGEFALGIVAAGLCMYGLFSVVEARYRRFKG